MSEWKPIGTAPKDEHILMAVKRDDGYFFVVGEVCELSGETHFLWRGDYSDYVKEFIGENNFNPTLWLPQPEK